MVNIVLSFMVLISFLQQQDTAPSDVHLIYINSPNVVRLAWHQNSDATVVYIHQVSDNGKDTFTIAPSAVGYQAAEFHRSPTDEYIYYISEGYMKENEFWCIGFYDYRLDYRIWLPAVQSEE